MKFSETKIKLLKEYSKKEHLNDINKSKKSTFNLIPLFSKNWENDENSIPYNISTYLLDAYYQLPERPDIAFLFFWECINNIYNDEQFNIERNKNYSDSKGIEIFSNLLNLEINKKYNVLGNTIDLQNVYSNLLSKCPVKAYHFISQYILKGIATENKLSSCEVKDLTSSYITFKKFCPFFSTIEKSYGDSYKKLCSPTRGENKVILNISDPKKSREIVDSFSKKLKKLLEEGQVTITLTDNSKETVTLEREKRIPFLIRHLLYAVRCNSFHGNIASRLNSIYADGGSYEVSKFICILSYFFINLSLIHKNKMNEDDFFCSLELLKLNYNI